MLNKTYRQLQFGLIWMLNNFLLPSADSYHASDRVYTDPVSHNSIFIGDIGSALDVASLQSQQIITVVTAAKNLAEAEYPPDIAHIIYPLNDHMSENASIFFQRFYILIEESLPKGSVLVHCAAGISRSSTLVLSYLMRKKQWGFKAAISFVRESRPAVLPNLGFERQLKKYEEYLSKYRVSSQLEKRSEARTRESRKGSAQRDSKSEVLPILGVFGKTGLNTKGFRVKQKDLSIYRIYNASGLRNQIKFKVSRAHLKASNLKDTSLHIGGNGMKISREMQFNEWSRGANGAKEAQNPLMHNLREVLRRKYGVKQNRNTERQLEQYKITRRHTPSIAKV